ncbi:ATP-binding Cassette (ABC) Superfamily [Achlya hypogyna]|uniref:ATP-binding Cassette (ABC) Superfamily n=1 Tax=Achlya hypogyna TaxID=1202772 RepID=A0A1V9YDM8_ACHHY|nr:ATP-binding Cassette (ABC) Superfamily [Achlya hypogyna]
MSVQSKLAGASALSFIALALVIREKGQKDAKSAVELNSTFTPQKTKGQDKKVAINKEFLERFMRLFRIIIPGIWTPEVAYAIGVAALLAMRTSFDITILQIITSIERAIIGRSSKDFVHHLSRFFLIMLPVSCVNCLLKYGHTELSLRFRTRLSTFLYTKYLHEYTYYKVSNLDARISNPDQLLTVDVERFATSVADLYSNVTKPLLDIGIYAVKLTGTIGLAGPATMLSYLVGSGMFLTWLRQPTGRFTIAEQRLEGAYRYINARLITHGEEIAFYNGNKREASILQSSFDSLVSLIRQSQQFRFSMSVIDNVIAKYFATVLGFVLVSRPFLDLNDPRHINSSHADRMQDYFRSGKMLMKLSEAMGRLVLSGRELTRLAGFTCRVADMITVLDDLHAGKYTRTMVAPSPDEVEKPLVPNSGTLKYADHVIEFENVPLVTPNGDVLVRSLSFKVKSGMNVVVCGPNGCGKSSLFRILGELWPMFGGKLTKPSRDNLFYIPQRPYLTLGSLRDQIIYPDTLEGMAAANKSDNDLLELLKLVQLEYLVTRDDDQNDPWGVVKDWSDVLSGGEKQRVAMARLFYHAPQFAILDECTSAVSVDVEGLMYSYCKSQDITLFTVSHRKSLWSYHDYVLKFDGRGAYEFRRIEESDAAFGS